MKSYVGMDVHSKSSVFVIQNERGEELGRGEVPTSREGFSSLRLRHGLRASTLVALESGTMAFFAARRLSELGLSPVVVDAREVRMKARRPRQKSDTRDAVELCEGIRRGIYRGIVHVPPGEIEHLRNTLSRRRHFVRLGTAEINAAKKMLRSAGLSELSRQHLGTRRAWQRLLQALAAHADARGFVELHGRAWQSAMEQKASCEKSLEEQRASFGEDLDRLKTVPGVGEIVALTAIAVFSDATRFPSAKHAASYAGLVPQTYQSGETNRQGHITRTGSPELRAMLVQAAHTARRQSSPLNPFLRNLTLRLGTRRAVTAVAHRLCRVLYAMLRDKKRFDASMLKAHEPRMSIENRRVYRLKPHAATSC
jgi:transposase